MVLRLNRLFVKAEHRDNPGGAVADRNASLEKKTIKLLRAKWPGVFLNHRRKLEVLMNWGCRKPFVGPAWKVAKRFDGELYRGEVVKYLEGTAAGRARAGDAKDGKTSMEEEEEEEEEEEVKGGSGGGKAGAAGATTEKYEDDLWQIEYEDGDTEQMGLEELKVAIALHRTTQGNVETELEAAQAFYRS